MVEMFENYFYSYMYLANTTRWPSVGLMLAHRLRRWPNIKPALGQRLVFAGITTDDLAFSSASIRTRGQSEKRISHEYISLALTSRGSTLDAKIWLL